jgi:hypothetical protein
MPARDARATRKDDESKIAVALYGTDEATQQRLATLIADGRVRIVGSASDPDGLQELLANAPADTMLLISRDQLDALMHCDRGTGGRRTQQNDRAPAWDLVSYGEIPRCVDPRQARRR